MPARRKALDAVDKAKTVLKNIFGRKKKSKTEAEPTPTATAPAEASSTAKPTETTSAAKPEPVPAAAPDASQAAPADSAPAAPAPASAPAPAAAAPADDKTAEKAALTEVKKATESRFHFHTSYGHNCDDGSRRRLKVGLDHGSDSASTPSLLDSAVPGN